METTAPSTGYLAPSFADGTVGDAMRLTHALVIQRASGRLAGIVSTLDVARVLAWGRA